mgnify:CR=1 FL=1
MNPNTIAITGATGFIGSMLMSSLKQQGYKVLPLGRNELAGSIDQMREKLDGCWAVINLAGAPIIQRWSTKNKEAMVKSRIQTTKKLVEAINLCVAPPKVFISASAVGIYTDNQVQTESHCKLSTGFAAQLCQDWEAESNKARTETRVVNPRIGIVLGTAAGALPKMLPAFRLGIGGTIGDGKQFFPWIHIDDLLTAFLYLLKTPSLAGPVNMVAPERITNKQFTQQLAKTLNRPAFIPIPAFALKLLYGEGASTLTQGQEVIPEKLLLAGFKFRYASIDRALTDLISSKWF